MDKVEHEEILYQILQQIKERAETVKNIPTSEDMGIEFPDGEQCYGDGCIQGRYGELIWAAGLVNSYMRGV